MKLLAAHAGKKSRTIDIDKLLSEIRACRICRDRPAGKRLAHEPRPVLRVSSTATICIASQAPGTRVHASGVPFTDPSGDRLRGWMGVEPSVFYDAQRIAIVPIGFCFPGLDAKGGDLPPRRECAPEWRQKLFAAMPAIELLLAVGAHAHRWHLGSLARPTLTETVFNWREVMSSTSRAPGPLVIPLPHPSWRNNVWLKRNLWFEAELLPALRSEISRRLHMIYTPSHEESELYGLTRGSGAIQLCA